MSRAADGRRAAAIALLLALHAALLLHQAWRDSPTFDEPFFLGGGLATWQGGHHVAPEGAALPMRLAGLAPRLAGASIAPDSAGWIFADAYPLGYEILYESGRDPQVLAFLSRLPIVLVSLLCCVLVHGIARRLFGPGPGLLALALQATSPVFLAHGHLATADVLAATTLLLATILASRCLERLTWGTLAASCAATALAFLAKMSAILLPAVVLVVVAARFLARAPTAVEIGRARLLRPGAAWLALVAAVFALHAATATFGLWAANDFRHAAVPASPPGAHPGELPRLKDGGWPAIERSGPTAPLVAFAREHRLLPETWLFGLQYTVHHAGTRRAYAEGRWSLHGWWWYFPRAFALKTPLAAIALSCLGLLALARCWREGRRAVVAPDDDAAKSMRSARSADLLALVPLIALVGVYGASAITSSLNIGIRHVLPMLPPVTILASAAWTLRGGGSIPGRAVALLAGLAVVEGLSSHPSSLAWMNVAAGPASGRWRHLADSNLDWGQGLRAAREAIEEERRPGEDAWLAYFGEADPLAEGLDVKGLPGFRDRWRVPAAELPGPGLHVVSATMLVQVSSRGFPGPWRPEFEAQWSPDPPEALRRWVEGGPDARMDLLQRPDGRTWLAAARHRDEMIGARLNAWLRVHGEPIRPIAGGALLMYRLGDAELRAALRGEPAELETDMPFPYERMTVPPLPASP